MELSQTLKQAQALSPQMIQSMEILQMSSQELLEHIEELAQENPVVETEHHVTPFNGADDLQRKLAWLESTDLQNRHYYRHDTEENADFVSNYGAAERDENNLYLYVLSQLQALDLDLYINSAAKFIIESLNGSGWLEDDVPALAKALGLPPETVDKALQIVQSLDPAGVGGRNLAECLSLQLHRRHGDHSLALRIVEECLDPLSKNRYHVIAEQLGESKDEVHAACDLIRSLNPRPGTGFAARENLIYINPDIIVVNFSDHLELLINDYFFPTISLNGYYCSLLNKTDDPEVKEYLTEKVRQAKWVIHSIEQRRSTLLSCAECILELQEVFFRFGPGHLAPMSLADVAARLAVHESTVSRAIKGKYLQCAGGIYPLSHFFSRGLGSNGAEVSPDKAKALLKELIADEDRKKPLSDQKLCELMTRRGAELSRRTVAKYRDELCIPSAAGRKQY